jgi:hypothetical protein
MPNPNPTAAGRPPAPGTHATVHLLVGDGRMPVVSVDVAEVVDRPVTYLRLQADDIPRHGTRHAVEISISGPPADVAALVAQLGEAVAAVEPPSTT